MKKGNVVRLLCALMFLPMCIMSCSDDVKKDNDNSRHQLLYGTWEEVKRESYKDGKIIPDYWTKGYSWTFKRDGSVIRSSRFSVGEGVYEFKNNEIKLYYDWGGMDETEKCEIVELNAESLVWKAMYPDEEYEYQILYLSRTTSKYDDPLEE